MSDPRDRDPDLEWLDHVRPVGLVVASSVLKELSLAPERQTQVDTATVAELITEDTDQPALSDPWAFFVRVLGWNAKHVAGAPGGPPLPESDGLTIPLADHDTTLEPHWAVAELGGAARSQLLVRLEDALPDERGALAGWEATPHQRFERLLRETGVFAGVLVTPEELRLVYAPKGETSGWLSFPLRPLATVAGRPMLGGLKLMLGAFRLFNEPTDRRLPALLRRSRDAQAAVSTSLSEQVLGALHELLRGFTAAEPQLVEQLAANRPEHLYEGLLTVLMRLVFILYAEDRDLIPSRTDEKSRELYEQGYSLRGLYAKLLEDAALNPDTMDERLGAWGWLLALFRLVHQGDSAGWIKGRGGKLFNPDAFPFLEARTAREDPPRVVKLSDGSVLRLLQGLMTLKGERLSYRALDVEQIGSVYETVMGFTVERATGPSIAIRAGKNNRTPVFIGLEHLLGLKAEARAKYLKEEADRGQISANQQTAIKQAKSVDQLVAALESIVDERASPQKQVVGAGTPILQPTDERRRTGSHYTPRSLTEPIVRYALEPAFESLGARARPEAILDLRVCDPAMGSGAFLVEACRALAQRLVQAWERWPDSRPTIPRDEDEELHARRLVAQRCLYGVDRNSMAADLAKLSLWLATLARDHEFTFLDHALKSGDSLVGLTRRQIAALNWDESKPGLPLFRTLVSERFDAAVTARAEIREAPDDVTRAIQELRNERIEARLDHVRLISDAVITAFFAARKPRAREKERNSIEALISGAGDGIWDQLTRRVETFREGKQPTHPFHWEIEFPEVFARDDPGFDAMVGNPPFAGKNTVIAGHRPGYIDWLQTLHVGAHGNSDLVAHFFRRAFTLLRESGVFGLIATNTIGQGDTRASGLTSILAKGGTISRAVRHLKWPGEAAVVVSVVHVTKRVMPSPILDGRQVRRISAYLVEGDLDTSLQALAANSRKAFVGSYVLGMGFTFDDDAAEKGVASSLAEMRRLIDKDPHNAERIFPFIGGDEVNTDPRHCHHRYVIDFFDRPLRRQSGLELWAKMNELERAGCRKTGVVPEDYPGEVAEDWPDLIEILRQRVKPERDAQKRDARRIRWWQYAEKQLGLYAAIGALDRVLVNSSKATPHHAMAFLPRGMVYSQNLNVFVFDSFSAFTLISSRPHEVWVRFLGTTFEDRLTYTIEDCFRPFPFPDVFDAAPELQAAGTAYYEHRAALMIRLNEGLTSTYNRFHDPHEKLGDIAHLRKLHHDMDRAVLRAYGWDDLVERAVPQFLDERTEDDHKYQGRYFWRSDFRDEVLARLIALNAKRAAAERAAGLSAGAAEDEELEEPSEAC